MNDLVSRLRCDGVRLMSAAALLVCLSASALAELPPYVYKEEQSKAPERITVKVKSVKTVEHDEPDRKRIDVAVEALVTKVERTRTRLRPGQTILIRYTRSEYKRPLAGPSEPPQLREGQTYPAFLAKSGKTYAPAAGGFSFSVIK